MNADILAFRISRRAIGTAALSDEDLSFCDGRHLTSGRDRAIHAAERYITGLIERFKPRLVVLFAPTNTDGVTKEIANRMASTVMTMGLAVRIAESGHLLCAFGRVPLKYRREIHTAILDMYPNYKEQTSRLHQYVAEATAAALVMETAHALETPT